MAAGSKSLRDAVTLTGATVAAPAVITVVDPSKAPFEDASATVTMAATTPAANPAIAAMVALGRMYAG
jgi:hypothetical protein